MAILNSDGSRSDTQTQVTAAAAGDTVLLPASGSFTWSSGDVTIPNTKWIILDFNGSTVALNGSSLTINPASSGNASHVTEVKGFSFTGPGGVGGSIDINDTATSSPFRLHHGTWAVSGTTNLNPLLNVNARGAGLIDHFTVTNIPASKEFIHINGWGSVDTTGWTTTAGSTLQGSAGLLYFEDCTFTGNSANSNTCWIQGYYGARAVIRRSSLNYTSFDSHGTPGNIGMRWWEIYQNTFTNEVGDNQGYPINIRAGSGVIWGNDASGMGSAGDIGMCEEDSGYPALYQPGRGLDQALDPAYVWSNTDLALALNLCDAPEQPNMVELNRDVYASQKSGYTPYTYPHPLQGVTNNITYSGTGTFTTVTIG